MDLVSAGVDGKLLVFRPVPPRGRAADTCMVCVPRTNGNFHRASRRLFRTAPAKKVQCPSSLVYVAELSRVQSAILALERLGEQVIVYFIGCWYMAGEVAGWKDGSAPQYAGASQLLEAGFSATIIQ